MELTESTNRIKNLNFIYQNSEVHQQGWHHGRAGREALFYNRAFMQSTAKTLLVRKAEAEAYMLRELPPVIKEGELIVGQPDYSPFSYEEQIEFDYLEKAMKGFPKIKSIGGHMSVYFPKLLQIGIEGILKEIATYRKKLDITTINDLEKEEFYTCVEIELKAVIDSAKNYADYAKKLADGCKGKRRQELLQIAQNLKQVPRYPARNFWEAVQSIHFFNYSLHNYFLYGRIDQYLYPYYQRDLNKGLITYDKAQELIDFLFLLPASYSDNFSSSGATVGGRYSSGELVDNDITKMVLTTCLHCKDTNNFIGYGITNETSKEMLKFSVELVVKTTQPIFFGDEGMVNALYRYGYSLEDAHMWVNTGIITTCFGKSSSYSQGPSCNLLSPLEQVLREFPNSYEKLKEIYKYKLREIIKKAIHEQNIIMLERARQGYEVFRISSLVDGCLESGKTVDQGGHKYVFSQPNFAGFANLIDSFAVLKVLVYETHKYTIQDFINAMNADYYGYDKLYNQVQQIPHYGTNDPLTNCIAQEVAQLISEACSGLKNIFGGRVLPGVYTYNYYIEEGKKTKATPDGRHAGELLSTGIYPAPGRETKGSYASLLSATSWDQTLIPVTPIYYIVFTPENNGGPSIEMLTEFVYQYLKKGGRMLRFAVASIDEIKRYLTDEDLKQKRITIAQFSMSIKKAQEISIINEFLAHNEHQFIKLEEGEN